MQKYTWGDFNFILFMGWFYCGVFPWLKCDPVFSPLSFVRVINFILAGKGFQVVLDQGSGLVQAFHQVYAHFCYGVSVFVSFSVHMASVLTHNIIMYNRKKFIHLLFRETGIV